MTNQAQATAKGITVTNPQAAERLARDERIKQRQVSPKTNPTNKDVMDAINDLTDLIRNNTN